MPRLEVRVPISPTASFFRQVEALAASASLVGAKNWDVRMVVSVGAEERARELPDLTHVPTEVAWRTIDPEDFHRRSYLATVLDRLEYDTDADVVMFADADVIITGSIEELLSDIDSLGAIGGAIAHMGPVGAGVGWPELFRSGGLDPIETWYEHPGWPFMAGRAAPRYCPAYFNFGAVFVPGRLIPRFREGFDRCFEIAASHGFDYFSGQVALAMALQDQKLPHLAIPMRYNFPNDARFEQIEPIEAADTRVLHYLRTHLIDRSAIWATPEATRGFLARTDLTASNDLLRFTIWKLAALGGVRL